MTQTATMEQERPITLRDNELLDRSRLLAEKVAYRVELVASKDADAKKWNGQIKDCDEEIARLGRVILDGFENRKQGDLFVDQALPKDEAARRLAEVAKRAERHPFVGAPGVGCTRDGCGRLADNEVHRPPTPSEPHTFVPDGKGEGNCWACGSGKDDPVHAEAPAGIESGNTPANETGEIAVAQSSTVECSRCSKTVEKAEVVYDRDVKPICETCKRAAVEAGTWPHVFRKGHEKARRCADCNGKADDAVHEVPLPPIEPTPDEVAAVAEKAAATGDPAYDFPEDEPPPNVIRSHRAIDEEPEEVAGGEA